MSSFKNTNPETITYFILRHVYLFSLILLMLLKRPLTYNFNIIIFNDEI
jgi:hypothetical protein